MRRVKLLVKSSRGLLSFIVCVLVACGGGTGDGSNSSAGSAIFQNRALIAGEFDINYPAGYEISVSQKEVSADTEFQIISFATNNTIGDDSVSNVAFCVAGSHFTEKSKEVEIANGISPPEFTQPISQTNISVDGRDAVEYIYVDLPDPDNPDDSVPLLAIGHQYYFEKNDTLFEQNLVIYITCAALEIGFAANESEFRSILNSVVIR